MIFLAPKALEEEGQQSLLPILFMILVMKHTGSAVVLAMLDTFHIKSYTCLLSYM